MAPEKRLFAFSILYLFVLFGALVADRVMLRTVPEDEVVRRRQRERAQVTALLLGAFVVLMFAITIAKMAINQ